MRWRADEGASPMRHNYAKVKSVICEDRTGSDSIHDTLKSLGIGTVKWCENLSDMSDNLDDTLVDLLVCDFDTAGDDFLDFIQEVRRRKKKGRNPFVIVIAAISDTKRDVIKKLIDAGVDDLVKKPLTSDRVAEGIVKFSRSRKPFVTSFDYVGPTRRSASRDLEDPGSLIQVPNTLHAKVVRNETEAQLQRLLDMSFIEMEDKTLEARANEILYTLDVIETDLEKPQEERSVSELLTRLAVLSDDLCSNTARSASQQLANLSKLFNSLAKKTQDDAGEEAIRKQIPLLGKLATAIQRAVTVERNAVELMQEMVELIASKRPAE